MYERTYGYRYDRSLTTKECAARMRADVKALTKAGMLPADWKVSIRYRSFAGGSSIDVRAVSPRPIYRDDPERMRDERIPHVDQLTDEARAVRAALEDVHNAYNHDGSEVQVDYFDVNFYGTVEVQAGEGVELWPGGRMANAWGW